MEPALCPVGLPIAYDTLGDICNRGSPSVRAFNQGVGSMNIHAFVNQVLLDLPDGISSVVGLLHFRVAASTSFLSRPVLSWLLTNQSMLVLAPK